MSNVIFNFSGEKYIVTGASSGMGRKIVLELAQAGAEVLAIARNMARLDQLKNAYPNNIIVASCDINNDKLINQVIDSFVVSHGKINGCVHAAGIDGITALRGFDTELAQEIMQTSFWAGVKLLQIASKNKYCNDGASFVFFSSVAAHRGEKGLFAYSAAKAAIIAAVKSFAKELANKKHRINTICPGRVRTSMTKDNPNEEVVNRHLLGEGNPEDVSGVVLFLLSDRARWITGSDIVVDGGYLIN